MTRYLKFRAPKNSVSKPVPSRESGDDIYFSSADIAYVHQI